MFLHANVRIMDVRELSIYSYDSQYVVVEGNKANFLSLYWSVAQFHNGYINHNTIQMFY